MKQNKIALVSLIFMVAHFLSITWLLLAQLSMVLKSWSLFIIHKSESSILNLHWHRADAVIYPWMRDLWENVLSLYPLPPGQEIIPADVKFVSFKCYLYSHVTNMLNIKYMFKDSEHSYWRPQVIDICWVVLKWYG